MSDPVLFLLQIIFHYHRSKKISRNQQTIVSIRYLIKIQVLRTTLPLIIAFILQNCFRQGCVRASEPKAWRPQSPANRLSRNNLRCFLLPFPSGEWSLQNWMGEMKHTVRDCKHFLVSQFQKAPRRSDVSASGHSFHCQTLRAVGFISNLLSISRWQLQSLESSKALTDRKGFAKDMLSQSWDLEPVKIAPNCC